MASRTLPTSNKPSLDWLAMEPIYRSGIRTLRSIGDEFGCSHSAIRKHAEANGWVRDLDAKIRATAKSKVSKMLVSKEVAKQRLVTENQVIEANANMQAMAILGERKDTQRMRNLVMNLSEELETTTSNIDLFHELGELMRAPDDNGMDKLNDIYRRVIALPSRIDSMKKLADTLKTLIALEREVLGIDAKTDQEENPIAALMKAISGKSRGLPGQYIEGEATVVDE